MKIRMLEHRSGPRYDGRTWPPVGEDFDVPDDEGAGLCAQGSAVPVGRLDVDVELRAAESPAEALGDAGVPRPAVNAPKAAWVAYAVGQGAAEAEALGLTKADLVSRYG